MEFSEAHLRGVAGFIEHLPFPGTSERGDAPEAQEGGPRSL